MGNIPRQALFVLHSLVPTRSMNESTSKSAPPKNGREKVREKAAFSSRKQGVGERAIQRTRGNPRDSTWVLLEKVNKYAKSPGKRVFFEGRISRDF